ncbi:MAG: sigma-54 dependent transcriptional regulator [Pirellulaceae bacterium]|nr:sigma-54 dependent transcriptional regulator [Pirellulaceae bacterium]
MTKILVIDDDRSIRHLIKAGLSANPDFEVITAVDGASGLNMVREEKPDVALLDIYLPEHNGLELFRKIRSLDTKLPVIFITGDTTSETAIEAMRAGAFDYLSKPLNIEQLYNLTVSAAEARRLMDQPVALPVGDVLEVGERFVGKAKAMLEVFKSIGRVSAQNITVLIRGESGSGKELVARALVNHSDRRDKPFVAVNCAAIPDQLLESELFGHDKGSFTGAEKRRIGRFEQCDGGTIFLDEVGDMSPVTQGKVLRLLQDQKFERVGGNELITTDVRIIAATNRPLEEMVRKNLFREDLLYRLNGITINLPPLRDRREDVPPLLQYFLLRAKSEMKRSELTGISPEALQLLINYDWPGNVRQLQSVVRQSLLHTTGTVIGPTNLPDFVRNHNATSVRAASNSHMPMQSEADESLVEFADRDVPQMISAYPLSTAFKNTFESTPRDSTQNGVNESNQPANDCFALESFVAERLKAGSTQLYDEVLGEVERRLFTSVLAATGGNQSRTAEILGITRGKVRDRIATFGISMDRTISVGQG